MVEALTSELKRVYRQRILTPVIIKSKHSNLSDVIGMAKEYIRPEMLSRGSGVSIGSGVLNNIKGKFQGSLTSFKPLESFDMLALPLFRDAIEDFADMREVEKIYLDKQMYALQYPTVSNKGVYHLKDDFKFTSTYYTRRLMGADEANEIGYKGQGMLASVPDTGANRTHSSVRGRVTVKSMMNDKGQYKDENGHGLWCVGCVGGSRSDDRVLGVPTEGMAPQSNLLSLKVLGYVMGMGFTSDIIESMEYSYNKNADVVSMSLGGPASKSVEEDPQCQVIKELTKKGMTFVVAGGNSGPDAETIGSPGTCPHALTVGAFDPFTGKMADFSSRGPTPEGATKPDVVAPGVNIHAPILGVLDGSGDKRTQRYSPISGTSMATPHTAGIVLLMKQAKRDMVGEELTVSEIKDMMGKLGKKKDNDCGWGFLNWQVFKEWMSTEYNIHVPEPGPSPPPSPPTEQ